VVEYLKPQKRVAHLFHPQPATETIARLQAIADRNIRKYGLIVH
jgi:pyruvate ferredoxin oxidoreductase beta subunit